MKNIMYEITKIDEYKNLDLWGYGVLSNNFYNKETNMNKGSVRDEDSLKKVKQVCYIDTECFHISSTRIFNLTVNYDSYIPEVRYLEYSFDYINWTVVQPKETVVVDVERRSMVIGGSDTNAYYYEEDIYGRYVIYIRGMMGSVPDIPNSKNALFHNVPSNYNTININTYKWTITNHPTAGYYYRNISISGRITTLVNYQNPDITSEQLGYFAFIGLFANCFSLVDASKLILDISSFMSYFGLFFNSTALKIGPQFKMNILEKYSCINMFASCTSLQQVPPSFTENIEFVKLGACNRMFLNCTSLTETGELKAIIDESIFTELSFYPTYSQMFASCTSLINGPSTLPSTTDNINSKNGLSGAYYRMFYGCVSLEIVPSLPSTYIPSGMYWEMFYNCKKITTVPIMPSYVVIYNLINFPPQVGDSPIYPAYYQMFYGCTSLTNVDSIPVPVGYKGLCYRMFYGCTSLKRIMQLPNKTLEKQCYYEMFRGCTDLDLQNFVVSSGSLEEWAIPTLERTVNTTAEINNLQCVTNMFAQTSSSITTPTVNTKLEPGETELSRPLVKYMQPASI